MQTRVSSVGVVLCSVLEEFEPGRGEGVGSGGQALWLWGERLPRGWLWSMVVEAIRGWCSRQWWVCHD